MARMGRRYHEKITMVNYAIIDGSFFELMKLNIEIFVALTLLLMRQWIYFRTCSQKKKIKFTLSI